MTEDVERFRLRARAWIEANLRPMSSVTLADLLRPGNTREEELAGIARERELQRMFFDAGLAGICVSPAYGGQGLRPAHQAALNGELAGYEFPAHVQAPTISPCMSVLLDFGTEEQKREHVPAILRGEELWMQFLSEPSGGSDLAGAQTTAVRDGDEWILNGSKVWTTGAWWSDWALCLARTNWEVPKHRGLTVFIFPIHQPGIEVHQIEMLNGSMEFCQEFLTDLRVPDAARVGEVDDGWTVATRWLFHERMLYNSPLVTFPQGTSRGRGPGGFVEIVRDAGALDDPRAIALLGEAQMYDVVEHQLEERIAAGIRTGAMSDQAAAVGRLFHGTAWVRTATLMFEVAGGAGAAWTDDDGLVGQCGSDFLMRQVSCIGGGTTEMARNVVSERVLGMPRERTVDKDMPFRDVPRSPAGRTS